MYSRNVTPEIVAALKDTPVIMLVGARQTGKTTLVRQLAETVHPAQYVTFDDLSLRAAAIADPKGFLAGFEGPVVFDEIQYVPDLIPAIKISVDRNRKPGRFLLTGSADVLATPRVSESLAGRMALFTLYPLSQGELCGKRESFIDAAFSKDFGAKRLPPFSSQKLRQRIVTGGYPEAQLRHSAPRRSQWFRDYANTIMQRDIKDLAHIEGLIQLPSMLSMLAARIGALLNQAELARSLQISQTTTKRYLSLLEATFLIWRLPAWSENLGKRLIKMPKVYFTDSGLAANLVGMDSGKLQSASAQLGSMVEGFVASELLRQASWSEIKPRLYHFREQTGREVDIVLEAPGGRCVLLEVKHSSRVRPDDLKNMRYLADRLGRKFARGILIYTGTEIIPCDSRFCVIPVNGLWELGGDG
jgi:predicted AAA+ superfamily ATPase